MMSPAKLQSLSNMLRRLFAVLVLGGLLAICSCEPVNRRHLLRTAEAIGCVDDEDDSSACKSDNTTDVSSPASENQTRTGKKVKQKSLSDDDDVKGEVSRDSKKRNRYGRILLYMIAAMKAALIYGLLHGVAALAGKAVLVAKVALIVAIAAILKKNDHEKTSYEIVKHPHHSYIQTHSTSVDYDHRNDYGEDSYDHRKRRQILR